jgi:hypothetical protein
MVDFGHCRCIIGRGCWSDRLRLKGGNADPPLPLPSAGWEEITMLATAMIAQPNGTGPEALEDRIRWAWMQRTRMPVPTCGRVLQRA